LHGVEIALVFGTIPVSTVLFAWDRFPADFVAPLSLVIPVFRPFPGRPREEEPCTSASWSP
jgi:hypothetical protein